MDVSIKPKLASLTKDWIQPINRNQSLVDEMTFNFNNLIKDISEKNDWNDSNINKLWLYNLHYFDDLNSIDADKRIEWHYKLIDNWIKHNPPLKGNGWEPYPTSLRIVNWIKWSLSGNLLKDSALKSLKVQVRFLNKNIETHLMGNHLFANAKALLYAGIFFSDKESNDWYDRGLEIISNELSEQVLKDGGGFELSTMYHTILLEDLLDILNILNSFNKDLPEKLINKINLMYEWLNIMSHPDGEISFFNDAAQKVAPNLIEIKSYIKRLNESNLIYINIDTKKKINKNFVDLNESGYSRVQAKNFVLIIDRAAIGPDYLPGHSHADTLSFEMSLFNKRVIVNSGTSTYENNNERKFQRGTSAHSTVTIDSQNSSETWKSFRVARRAKIFNLKNDLQRGKIIVSASHNGYARLKGKPIHTRKWKISRSSLEIIDDITGTEAHDIQVIFPLHPDVKILDYDIEKVFLDVLGNKVEINFVGQGELDIQNSLYHKEFGLSLKNMHLHYNYSGKLPVQLISKVIW
tara:strand:- start:8104 stop:9666 length:1563 start_codon:yes stop_codon:yes gene_type:complete